MATTRHNNNCNSSKNSRMKKTAWVIFPTPLSGPMPPPKKGKKASLWNQTVPYIALSCESSSAPSIKKHRLRSNPSPKKSMGRHLPIFSSPFSDLNFAVPNNPRTSTLRSKMRWEVQKTWNHQVHKSWSIRPREIHDVLEASARRDFRILALTGAR